MDNITANHSQCIFVDYTSRRRIFLFLYLGIILMAIPANLFFLYVSWRHIRQKNELGVYLFNLALSDLTFTAGLALWLDYLWSGAWTHGGYMCLVSVYSLFTNFYTSHAMLCCVAVNRYLAVAHPLKYTSLRSIWMAALVSVGIWGLVLCFNASTIRWEDSYFEGNVSMCFDNFMPLSETMVRANILRFTVGFSTPLSVAMFATWGTCLAVKTNQTIKEEERRRIMKLLAMILVSVIICFGPAHVMMLLRMLVDDCENVQWYLYCYKISTIVSSLNCLADPFIYCFITPTGKSNISMLLDFFSRQTEGER
ncbi:G protein-coupled receptor 65 [Synchiropus picturatus]